jgi:hypothetical protein
MTARARRRARAGASRGLSAVEVAAGISLLGSLLAVAVPTFFREIRASRFVEPIDGLAAIAGGAVGYASIHGGPGAVALAFPRSVALTPTAPPRARTVTDPQGTWNDATWGALHFPPPSGNLAFTQDEPHAFAFAFDSTPGATRSSFVAHAHGDLDGDGTQSTFEVRGHMSTTEAPVVEPGMYVEAPLE